ncbi:DUF5955 family protein [Streptomyces fragilis]|uniref:DUF5955 family protein n=1 Tax=Streptomyces fragilis TaxID=67301 RepID=A0ABV2YQ93_9ACTN|nr:DUF5955 family protein [Streptomyces fragilis]
MAGLKAAVARLRRELASYRVEFTDRAVAEEEIAGLAALAAEGSPDPARLRRSLLLIASAVGSVSALAGGMRDVRHAVERFDSPAATV